MALTVAQGFEKYLEWQTPLASQKAAAASHRVSVENSLRRKLSVRSMRETGSFSHGTGVRNYSDVDVLVSIGDTKPGSSDTPLNWVRDALKASFPGTVVRVSRPAVVVEFAGGTEAWEVIPGFLKFGSSSVYEIPAPGGGWIDTAPTEHLAYVNECNSGTREHGRAKKLARLIKAWKYHCNVPVSSFYLEMRAAQYMADENSFVAIFDMCALVEGLQGHGLAAMNDPKGFSGRFHPCSSDAKKREALSKLDTAATRARKALDAYRSDRFDDSFYYLDLLFGGTFPAR